MKHKKAQSMRLVEIIIILVVLVVILLLMSQLGVFGSNFKIPLFE